MRYILLTTFLLTFASFGFAGEDGGTSSPFSFGAGTRELAMGGAVLAESDASSAPFWNSSRLASAQRYSVTGLHSRLFFPGNVYQYFGIAVPTLDQGGFGLGIFRQGINGIEKRDDANQLLGETQNNNLRIYLAHGRSWSGYDLGMAVTLETHSLDGLSATSSPGVDLSAGKKFYMDKWWLKQISTAINIRNLIRPGIRLADVKYLYRTENKVGAVFSLQPNDTEDHKLVLASSITMAKSRDTKLALGLEYSFMNLMSLRGGMADKKWSVGFGLQYEGIGFDYALVDRELASIHLLSLTKYFGKPKNERISDRLSKRDADFRSVMNQQFADKNNEMMEELIKSGKRHLSEANYTEAVGELDRALFLARSNGSDTVAIYELVSKVRNELDLFSQQQEFDSYIDSAQTCSDRQDYIGAKYFANKAISLEPYSETAQQILLSAEKVMRKTSSREKMIADKLKSVDSALYEENYDQASILIKSLEEVAPDNESVQLRATKIENELLKIALKNPTLLIDTPEEIVSHTEQSSFSVNENVKEDSLVEKIETKNIPQDNNIKLSPQLEKEVDELYNVARKHFENGQLDEAVTKWEQVDRTAPGYKSVREYLIKAYTFLGANLYAQKERKEALEAWNKVISLDPENKEVLGYIKRTINEINKLKALSYEK